MKNYWLGYSGTKVRCQRQLLLLACFTLVGCQLLKPLPPWQRHLRQATELSQSRLKHFDYLEKKSRLTNSTAASREISYYIASSMQQAGMLPAAAKESFFCHLQSEEKQEHPTVCAWFAGSDWQPLQLENQPEPERPGSWHGSWLVISVDQAQDPFALATFLTLIEGLPKLRELPVAILLLAYGDHSSLGESNPVDYSHKRLSKVLVTTGMATDKIYATLHLRGERVSLSRRALRLLLAEQTLPTAKANIKSRAVTVKHLPAADGRHHRVDILYHQGSEGRLYDPEQGRRFLKPLWQLIETLLHLFESA